jgi:hypothetical protein
MKRGTILTAICASALLALATESKATSMNFTGTGTGLDAEGDFTWSAGSLTIVLKDLEQNPTSAGQLINGVTFDISGATGSGSLTTTGSGNVTTISSGGAYTAGTPDPLSRYTTTHTGVDVTLTALGGGQPSDLIIGPDSNGGFDPTKGKFSNANASIINFNPNVLGTATFTITIPGITSSSVISDVVFTFGTQAGEASANGVPHGTPPIPDGGMTAVLLGGALLSLQMFRRKFAR